MNSIDRTEKMYAPKPHDFDLNAGQYKEQNIQ